MSKEFHFYDSCFNLGLQMIDRNEGKETAAIGYNLIEHVSQNSIDKNLRRLALMHLGVLTKLGIGTEANEERAVCALKTLLEMSGINADTVIEVLEKYGYEHKHLFLAKTQPPLPMGTDSNHIPQASQSNCLAQ